MLLTLGLAALAVAQTAQAIPTISAKGSKFFTSDGNQFYIKGVAYQLTSDDPLSDSTQCANDIKLMQTLGANTIRVYHVDSSANHDACMQSLSDAGIYLFVDLDTVGTYIEANDPAWTQSMYQAYSAVMDAFQSYDNTAGFFVGNEVMTTGNSSIAAPYVKAAARDMKAYRDSKGYRDIPVGYSAADIAVLRPNLQNYMACSSNASENLDFFSLNAYEWCGDSSYDQSGYVNLEANASSYSIPIFFSETGCNTPEPRTFDDQSAIFGTDMENTWSGAIIYEWIEETNNYGLISYGPSVAATATGAGVVAGYTRTGTPTPISPDFSNLSQQWATLSPSGVSVSAYSATNSPPACPAYTSGAWEVSGDVALPTLGQTYNAAVLQSSAGTAGASSQTGASSPSVASTPSSTTPSVSSSAASSTSASSSLSSTGSSTGTASSGSSASGTGAAASASATKSSADRLIAGMSAGLAGVMLIFIALL